MPLYMVPNIRRKKSPKLNSDTRNNLLSQESDLGGHTNNDQRSDVVVRSLGKKMH